VPGWGRILRVRHFALHVSAIGRLDGGAGACVTRLVLTGSSLQTTFVLCAALVGALLVAGCGNTCVSDADCEEDRPFCEAEQCAECRSNADCRASSINRTDGGPTSITLGQSCQQGTCESCRCVNVSTDTPAAVSWGLLGLLLFARRRTRGSRQVDLHAPEI